VRPSGFIRRGRPAPIIWWTVLALGVAAPTRGLQSDGTRRLRGVVTGRIGDIEGPQEYLFGRISGLALARDHRIVVADWQSGDVRVFGPNGAFLTYLGSSGGDPGELHRPCCVGVDAHGRVWVMEAGSVRYEVFALRGAEGRHLRTMSAQVVGLRAEPPMFRMDGSIVLAVASSGRNHGAHVLVDSGGRVRESVVLPEFVGLDSLGRGRATIRQPDGDETVTYPYPPFGARDRVAHAPDGGFARVVTGQYTLTLFDGEGSERATVSRPEYMGPEIDTEERRRAEHVLDSLQRYARRLGGEYPDFEIPRRKPPVEDLWYDGDGRLWVELATEIRADIAKADVYDQDGTLLFRASWPKGINLSWGAIERESAVGTERGALDVQRVVLLRFVTDPPRGGGGTSRAEW